MSILYGMERIGRRATQCSTPSIEERNDGSQCACHCRPKKFTIAQPKSASISASIIQCYRVVVASSLCPSPRRLVVAEIQKLFLGTA
jgi:hypothetical protein